MRRTKQKSSNRARKRANRAPLMMALEPRIMFDGAAAPTAHAIALDHHDGASAAASVPERHVTASEGPSGRSDHDRSVDLPVRTTAAPAVIFIDSRVEDPASLLKGMTKGTEVVFLKPDSDGLQQMAAFLEQHHEVGSVQIIAHGGAGDLLLGSTDVTAENVQTFARTLQTIGSNLRPGADILVYACSTAGDTRGVSFVDALAKDTGHVVAASSNVTGIDGDWNLEIATGTVTAKSALAASSEARYAHDLSTTAVSTAAQLNAAILADDVVSVVTNDTITLTSDITYASAADAVNIVHLGPGTLTIDGGGHTINAAYLSRVLTVTSGNVILENVTLEHGLLAGAGALLSLPGVSELGAGISNAGTLTLNNVTVTQNSATGGGGGGGGTTGASGGGGSGANGIGGAAGGGLGTAGSGSSGGKGSGTHGGLGGTSSGGGGGGTVSAVTGASGSSGGTATVGALTVGGGGGGAGYLVGSGGAGGNAAGGIYNSGTLNVIGSTSITNNLAAGGGGGGGNGSLLGVPSHGGVGGQGVGGIWNAATGVVNITAANYSAISGNVGASGTIGGVANGGSNAGYSTAAAVSKINTNIGTINRTYVPSAPTVASIAEVGSSTNNATSEAFTVKFSESVTGVTAANFSLTDTGTAAGVISVASVSGSGDTYTVSVSAVTGDGTMRLNVNSSVLSPILDASGNAFAGSYVAGPAYTIDHAPPLVSSITGPAANPNNLSTDSFTVTFSEAVGGVDAGDFAVAKTGTVSAGVSSVTAINPDANGRAASYTVVVGGTGGVGNVTGDGTLELNLNATGTGITDAAGNAIVGGAVGPVYAVEHTAPVVTSINTVGAGTNNASSDSYTVTFSEAVSTPSATDFSLTNTGTAGGVITSILPVTSSGSNGYYTTYTVLVNPAIGDGTMRLDFHPVLSPVDTAGNPVAGAFTSGQVYTIEHTPPVATSILAAGANPNHSTSDTYTVTFSESVSGVDASDFTLVTAGVTGSITSVTAVNPDANGRAATYTVTVGGVTGNGTLQLNLNSSGTGITDAAGNALVVGTAGQPYVIVQTPPVATSITGPAANPNNLSSDTFTVNFSEAVGGVDSSDFTLLKTGTVSAGVSSVTAINPDANGRAASYTVVVGGTGGVGNVTGDGTLELNLNATGTGITDAAGNAIVGGAVGPVYAVEHTAPVVTSINTVGAGTNNASSDSYTVTFSEAVSTPSATDFSLTNTGTAGGVITSILPVTSSGSNGYYTTYTVLVNPAIGDGTMRLDFHPVLSPVDTAGNPVAGAFTSGQVYTIEHTPPVATSILAAAGDSPTAASEQFTVNFTENVSGVDAADFTLAKTGTVGGSITSVTAVNPDANGRAATYTLTVGGVTGIGTLGVNLNNTGTGITDAAGNAIVGGAVGQPYAVTHTLPTVSSIVLNDPATNNLTSEQFTVTFSEGVSGVNAADFSLATTGTAGGVITSIVPVTSSGSNGYYTSYTVLVSPVVGDGTLRLDLNPLTTVVDASGNTTAGGYNGGPTYTIEHTPPAVTTITGPASNPNNLSTDAFTVNFSEAVSGVDAGDFSVATTGSVAAAVTSVTAINPDANGRATSYAVTVGGTGGQGSSVSGTGTLQLNLNTTATGISDAAGNGIAGGAFGPVYAVGHTMPAVTSIATVGPSPNDATSDQFTVTFSENVSGVSAADFVVAGSGVTGAVTGVTPINAVNGAARSYTVTVGAVLGTGTLGLNFVSPVAGQPVDAYGNVTSGTFTGAQYTVDQTPPTASSITAAAGNTSTSTSDQFTVTFSEPVTGVDTADFTLVAAGATGTIASVVPVNPVNGAASVYTVSVDGVHGTGTLELNLNASGTGITDAVGNPIVGGALGPVFGVSVTAPSITSIALVDASTNNLGTEQFTVNFSENVGGVVPGDFVLTDSGVTGSIVSATAVNPDGNGRASAYTVTVAGVTGNGTMRLDLSASQSGITDASGAAVSGGYTGGPSYTIDHTAPTVASIALVGPATNNATTEQFTVNFSENVGGLQTGDFVLTDSSGLSGTIASVTAVNPDANGRASSYTVTVNNISGNGTMRLDLAASQSGITDAAGNAAVGGYTGGSAYTINHTAPVVSSMSLVDAGTNNLTSDQFTVNFSENVSGVDALDFALHTTGTASGTLGAVVAVNPDANGRASTYTVTVNNVTGDGTLRLDLSGAEAGITDAAGNAASGGYAAGPAYTVEHTPPTVTSVAAVNVGPSDSSTQVFTVDFSEGVSGVTAADFTAATTGTVSAGNITVSPAGPFSNSYTVTVSGVSGNGTLGLNVNTSGTGISDAAGNAILGGFSTGTTVTIDNTPPAIRSIALVDAPTNNLNAEHFTVTFTKPVTGVDAGDFVLTDGGTVAGSIASVTAVNPDVLGYSNTYAVTVNGVTGDGSMRLDLRASESGITDLALNSASGGYTAGPSYAIEHTPPVVTSIALVGAATNNASSEQFTVNFSENVGGVGLGDFVLANGGTVGGTINSVVAVNPDASGRATAYLVTVGSVVGDGSMKLDLSASQSGIEDAAGNALTGGYAAGPTYTIEHTAPVVSAINLVDAATNNLGSEHFTVSFSENVGGVVAGDFVLTDGGSVSGSVVSATAVNPDSTGRASTYNVTVNHVVGDGTMRLDLNAAQSGITDAAGNAVSGGYTSGPAYSIEHTPPQVTGITLAGAATNNANTEQFTVNFSENVGGLAAGDFVLTTSGSVSGTIGAITAVNPDANGRSTAYTVTVNNVTGDGTLRLDVSASQSGILDAAGNAAAGGYSAGPAYTVEHTAPSVSSIGLVGSASNDDASEQFTVNFSQSVSGVNAGDFSLTTSGTVGGSITSVTPIAPDANGRASAYTVTVTGVTGIGTMRLDLNNGTTGIVDTAGNTVAAGYAAGPSYDLGSTVPAVQSISAVGPSTSNATSEQFVVKFSENVTGVDASDFALTDTGSAAGSIVSVTGSGTTYTVTVNGVSGDGTMRLDLNGNGTGIVDAANHAIQTGFTTGQVVTLDHTPPSLSSVAAAGADPSNAATQQFTVQFSENVSGVDAGDFHLVGTGTAAGTISSITGSGSSYVVTVINVTGDGTLRLELNGNGTGIVDAAGNAVTAPADGASQPVTIDHTAPVITSVTPLGANPSNGTTEQFTVTYSENVTGVDVGDFVVVGTGTASGIVTSVTGSGGTYVVTVGNVSGDGTLQLGLTSASAGVHDQAGNAESAGDGAAVGGQNGGATIDHTPPAVSSVTAAGKDPSNAATEQYTVTFSESVNGVNAGDFSLVTTGTASGTISSVSGSGGIYVVTVTDVSGNGTLRLDVNAGTGITDSAGNRLVAGAVAGATVTLNHDAPVVESVSGPTDGTYTAGQKLDFTVDFSEPVVIDTTNGTPRIALDIGGVTRYATLVGGNGTNALTFEYVVGAADRSMSGITVAGSIDLNGAVLTDLAGNAGVPSLANVGSSAGVNVGAVAATKPYMGYVDHNIYDDDALPAAGPTGFDATAKAQAPTDGATLAGFSLSTFDRSITVPNLMGVMTVPVETQFSFTVPVGSFQFAPGSVVVVHATLANGDPLPAWMSFDPTTGKFEGDALEFRNEHLHIIITARDQNGREVMMPIELKFSEPTAADRPTPDASAVNPLFGSVDRLGGHDAHSPAGGKASLAAQFSRHGRLARQHQLGVLMARV